MNVLCLSIEIGLRCDDQKLKEILIISIWLLNKKRDAVAADAGATMATDFNRWKNQV